ncbi:ATP-binding cassette domain-containing protein [Candidatus Parcubacteria bacterium]|nr:ATP-binding cassette domain-containing protein [Candidatus Parcubacteria bacterium]
MIIEVKNLSKKFGDREVVKHISFNVERGEIFAFLGPNGAGKTTTIKMLTTLLPKTDGEIKLNNFDPEDNPDEVRKSFGIVFQDPSLDTDLTTYENMEIHAVLYGMKKEVYRPRIEELLKLVELHDRRGDYVKNFSGGMKRRLEIARGLLHHPKVLFLDEPTLGLDPQTRNLLWNYIRDLNQKENITVFLTTHYMNEAEKMANRIAIIDHGVIVDIGTSEELMSRTGTDSLEAAFLKLTGHAVREEEGENEFRNMAKMWTGKR